jgi:hypothetical protein
MPCWRSCRRRRSHDLGQMGRPCGTRSRALTRLRVGQARHDLRFHDPRSHQHRCGTRQHRRTPTQRSISSERSAGRWCRQSAKHRHCCECLHALSFIGHRTNNQCERGFAQQHRHGQADTEPSQIEHQTPGPRHQQQAAQRQASLARVSVDACPASSQRPMTGAASAMAPSPTENAPATTVRDSPSSTDRHQQHREAVVQNAPTARTGKVPAARSDAAVIWAPMSFAAGRHLRLDHRCRLCRSHILTCLPLLLPHREQQASTSAGAGRRSSWKSSSPGSASLAVPQHELAGSAASSSANCVMHTPVSGSTSARRDARIPNHLATAATTERTCS